MRRSDTAVVGDEAEAEAKRLLEQQGFTVHNLNVLRRNYPTYDLIATKGATNINISVKCARAKRDLALVV